jgi:hypothetical protein
LAQHDRLACLLLSANAACPWGQMRKLAASLELPDQDYLDRRRPPSELALRKVMDFWIMDLVESSTMSPRKGDRVNPG